MKIFIFLALVSFSLVLAFVSACSHPQVSKSAAAQAAWAAKEQVLYNQGLRDLNRGDDVAAAKCFENLLNLFPTTAYLPQAFYNWGLALEGQQKFPEAADKYKKAAAFFEGTPSADGAQALYRLSICYEAMGDDAKTILALLELKHQSSFVSKQIAETELPARLAGAYAREGNIEQADINYALAEKGLRLMRRTALSSDGAVWLPKTLYSMGRVPPLDAKVDPTSYRHHIDALIKDQSWLLRCAELNSAAWSPRAAEELSTAYQNAWEAIDQYAGPAQADKMQAMKIRQDDQRSMGADLDSAVSQLRLERLPSSPAEPEPKSLTDAFQKIDSISQRLNILLQAPDVQDQVTPEAQKREGLRRPLRGQDGTGRQGEFTH